jgi:hypothetical protein
MFQAFFLPPAFDGLPSDGFFSHSCPPSRGKLLVDPPSFLLSETGSPYILRKLTLVTQTCAGAATFTPNFSFIHQPEESPADTWDALPASLNISSVFPLFIAAMTSPHTPSFLDHCPTPRSPAQADCEGIKGIPVTAATQSVMIVIFLRLGLRSCPPPASDILVLDVQHYPQGCSTKDTHVCHHLARHSRSWYHCLQRSLSPSLVISESCLDLECRAATAAVSRPCHLTLPHRQRDRTQLQAAKSKSDPEDG